MEIELDFRSPLSLTEQIVEQVRQQIASGVLKPGEQLPTVRSLATELRINFNTVARAYRILDKMGLISTQQGRGTYVTEIPPPATDEGVRREMLETLTRRYLDDARQLGFSKNEIEQMVSKHLQSWSESI
ncbi:MAG: GntR family transcriptional regulator [Anaerolineae bacterium]